MSYIDISPTISSELAVFPGDVPFQRKVGLTQSQGDHLDLSSVQTTLHIGAHADAPIHYHKDGESIAQRSLDYYIGLCQVIPLNLVRGQRIQVSDLKGIEIMAPRILFATDSQPSPNQWVDDFNSLSPEVIDYLFGKGVSLVGIDTPSIDPAKSEALESHQMIFKKNMAVLEGLVLKDVKAGVYQLVALPLKIQDADASPVRAVLFPIGEEVLLVADTSK